MQKGRILLSFLLVSVILITLLALAGKRYIFSAKRSVQIQISFIQPTATPSPTLTPTPSPTITPSPTPSLTPTPTPKPKLKPSPTPSPIEVKTTSSGQNSLLSQVNEYRKSNGLSPVASNAQTCAFAKIRAQEIASNFNHDGFTSRMNNKTLPYPSYREITENIAMNSDEGNVVAEWIKSSGHAENMRKDTPYVCIEKSGSYYAYEGWKP